MLTLYPLAVASGATALAWMLPFDFGSMRALRVISVLAAMVTVLVSSGAHGAACDAFSSTQTWQLVSRDRYGWIVAVLGLALLAARPMTPTTGVTRGLGTEKAARGEGTGRTA
jgi:hypothetical protein